VASLLEQQLHNMVNKLHILIREQLRQDMEQSTLDKIFTMFETWLKLDQDLSRELSVNIFQGALDTYVKGELGMNSPSNFSFCFFEVVFEEKKKKKKIGIFRSKWKLLVRVCRSFKKKKKLRLDDF
jgi:hypothetical protein